MQHGRISVILFLVILSLGFSGFAQNAGKITGIVKSADGAALPGCNIIVENTGLGAATDGDGYFLILNLPPGDYEVRAEMIGYRTEIVRNVRVTGGLTTRLEFKMKEESVAGQEVVVEDFRIPPVQKDLTYKVQGISEEEMRNLPINSLYDAVLKQAGVTRMIATQPVSSMPNFGQFATIPTDGFHFRGGRTNETLYLFDGVVVNDGLWGGFNMENMGELTLSSLEVLSGTFSPKFGEAMSAVVSMTTFNTALNNYKFQVRGYTDNLGTDSWKDDTYSGELNLRGPVPALKNTSFSLGVRNFTTDGNIRGYVYPNYVDSEGQDKSGSPEEISMNYRDNMTVLGKLMWQPSNSFSVSVGGFLGQTQQALYNHYFKYNPYGTPRQELDDYLGYVRLKHVLSSRTFYSLTLAQYQRKFNSRIYDNPEDYAIVPQNGSAEFSISGEDWVYFDSEFKRNELSANIVSQVSKMHELQGGFSVSIMKTYLERRNPDGFEFLELYDLEPRKYGAYLGDKMEFEEIGLIVNAGLRLDYIDPNRQFVQDLANIDGDVDKVDSRFYMTPRLGLSFPIAERAAFRFGYGHYYQFPDFFKVYQGLNADYERYPRPNPRISVGAIARGDLKEERTVNYEAGVQAKLNEEVSLDVVGFYRKFSNLIGTTLVEDASGLQFESFDNINFATVKGLEISLKKRFSNNFSSFFNYTFSQTLVSSSYLFLRPQTISRTFAADWDQPHIFNANLSFYFPDNKWGFDVSGSLQSGFPYTANNFEPNEERAPYIHQLDLNLYKEFDFAGMNQRLFVRVFNLPNRKNIWWVYADSGKPGVDANPATSDDYTNNPAMWGPGRRIEIGLSIAN